MVILNHFHELFRSFLVRRGCFVRSTESAGLQHIGHSWGLDTALNNTMVERYTETTTNIRSRRRKRCAHAGLLGVSSALLVLLPVLYYSMKTSSKWSRDSSWDDLDGGVRYAVASLRVGEGRKTESRHGSRGVVMCAYNNETLHLAWVQIQVLRRYHGMRDDPFIIYHADELNSTMTAALRSVSSLPGVRIENLKGWAESTYPDADIHDLLKPLRSFVCKPAALLASPYDITALIDLDVILARSPWDLLSHPIYERSGAYLFSDRRVRFTPPFNSEEAYRETTARLWYQLNSGAKELPTQLTESPVWRDWSYDVGESAVVVMDKRRHARGMWVLEQLMSPTMYKDAFNQTYGDKEIYWKALALANETLEMNPIAWTAVGYRENWKLRTCSHRSTLAQWVPDEDDPDNQKRIVYLNGDGVNELLLNGEQALFTSSVSWPLDYYDPSVPVNVVCSPGFVPMPPIMRKALEVYDAIASVYPLGPVQEMQRKRKEVLQSLLMRGDDDLRSVVRKAYSADTD